MADEFGPYPGIVRDWHDGDTCHVDLDVGFGFELRAYNLDEKPRISCRIFGINSPELGKQEPQATEAKTFAEGLCPPGTHVMVLSHSWDKYGKRFDGSITLPDGKDFGTEMLASGHAVVETT